MTLKIMSWNVRGVNNQDKRKVLKAFIRLKKVDMVCLQETKVQNMSVGLVSSLGVGRFLDWGTVDAVTPRPERVYSICDCRGAYVHQVPL